MVAQSVAVIAGSRRMECGSAPSKASSFAVSSRLRWTLVAVNDKWALREVVWVISAPVGTKARSDRRQHAGKDLEPEVLLVAEPVRAALEDADLVVQPLDEAERDLVLRAAIGRDPVPVPINHRGEFLVRPQ